MFSVLVIRLRSLRLLRVSGIVMRLRMFLLLITFLKASHSFRNRLLVLCKNAHLFATMIMTSVRSEERRVGKESRSRRRPNNSKEMQQLFNVYKWMIRICRTDDIELIQEMSSTSQRRNMEQ